MQATVTEDRQKYIGGSDIPSIMGISPFTSRMTMLLFKAGLEDNTFHGNEYTEYGNRMESKIREHINDSMGFAFAEDKKIDGGFRAHVDGADHEQEWILEVKTTSHISDDIKDYKMYVVQLLFYMTIYHFSTGLLAVYERPEDMSEEFDSERLQMFTIHYEDYKDMVDEIKLAIKNFQDDLAFLKDNPLSTEDELPSRKQLAEVAKQAVSVGDAEYSILWLLAHEKAVTDAIKQAKELVQSAMEQKGIKNATFEDGTSLSYVPESPKSMTEKFDEKAFKKDHPDLYNEYLKEQEKKGRKAYVSIRHKKDCEHERMA